MTRPADDGLVHRYLKLAFAVLCGVAVWCSLLPRIAQAPAIKQWIEPLREQGIDPSALYYTDVFSPVPQQ